MSLQIIRLAYWQSLRKRLGIAILNFYRLLRCRSYYGILGTVKGAGIRFPSIDSSPLYDFRQRAVFEQPLVGRKSYARRPHSIWNIIWSRLITYSHV